MSDLRIGVVGATGALGRQLVAACEASEIVGEVVLFASRASRATTLDVHGEALRVRVPTLPDLAALDAVILALPPSDGEGLLPGLLDEGVPVIDPTGVFAAAPLFVPWANAWAVEDLREDGGVRVPGPLALLASAVVQPLHAAFGLSSVRGTALLSASVAGKAAVDELAGQVIALFNQDEPPRAVFREGLAFDVLPSWGEPGASGWFGEEERAAVELAAVLGLPSETLALTALVGPLFSGIFASLAVVLEQQPAAEGLLACLDGAPLVQLVEGRPLMPRAREGLPTVGVGRLRDDPAGGALHLVASADPQALVAGACLEILRRFREIGQL